MLDMKNKSEMLMASREELEKCKTKNTEITDYSINQVYAEAAHINGIQPIDSYEALA